MEPSASSTSVLRSKPFRNISRRAGRMARSSALGLGSAAMVWQPISDARRCLRGTGTEAAGRGALQLDPPQRGRGAGPDGGSGRLPLRSPRRGRRVGAACRRGDGPRGRRLGREARRGRPWPGSGRPGGAGLDGALPALRGVSTRRAMAVQPARRQRASAGTGARAAAPADGGADRRVQRHRHVRRAPGRGRIGRDQGRSADASGGRGAHRLRGDDRHRRRQEHRAGGRRGSRSRSSAWVAWGSAR